MVTRSPAVQHSASPADRLRRRARVLTPTQHEQRVAWGKMWGHLVSEAAKELRKERG